MAISKLILNGEVQMDVTSNTNVASNMLNGVIGTKNDGTQVTGNIASKSSSDLTASGATVTAPAGYYSASASKSVTTMTLPTTTSTGATSGYTLKATLDRSTSDRYLNIAPGYNSAGGYYKINKVANGSVTAPSSISGTSATVSTGTNTLTLTKSVSVTPNVTTAGYISSGTAGNSSISLTASINTRSSSDLTVSGATVTAPAGYYSSSASKSVASGTAGTPTATKGTVSNHAVTVTPSVTNTTGYITGSTKTGTAVTVSASELVSGTKSITENGTGVDVTNYASVDVAVTTNVTPLTVTPSDEVQVFDGFEILKNLGPLSGTGSSSSSVKSITIPVDLSEIEYGETYHIVCDYAYVYQGGQFANTIKFDTDWVASENGSVPFEYITHEGTTWNITSITLSKTELTVKFSANNGGLTFRTSEIFYRPRYTVPHDFIIKAKSEAQGYLPVTVEAIPSSGASWIPVRMKADSSYAQSYCCVCASTAAALSYYQNRSLTTSEADYYLPEAPGYPGWGILCCTSGSIKYWPSLSATSGNCYLINSSPSGNTNYIASWRIESGSVITLGTTDLS